MILFQNSNRGLVKMIIIIFIALLLLAYFGLNLRSIVGSQTFQDNWNFLSNLAVNIWNNYLKGFVAFIWNSIIVPIISKSATQIEQQKVASSTSALLNSISR
jgi:hypothetical protein